MALTRELLLLVMVSSAALTNSECGAAPLPRPRADGGTPAPDPDPFRPLAPRHEMLARAVEPVFVRMVATCCSADGSELAGNITASFGEEIVRAYVGYRNRVDDLNRKLLEVEKAAGADQIERRRRELLDRVDREVGKPRGLDEVEANRAAREQLIREGERELRALSASLWTAHADASVDHIALVDQLISDWRSASRTAQQREVVERAGRRLKVHLTCPLASHAIANHVVDFGEVVDLTAELIRASREETALGAILRRLGVDSDTPWLPLEVSPELAQATEVVDEAIIAVGAERVKAAKRQIATGSAPRGLAPGTDEYNQFMRELMGQQQRGFAALDRAVEIMKPVVGAIDPVAGHDLDTAARGWIAPRLFSTFWVEPSHPAGVSVWLLEAPSRFPDLGKESAELAQAVMHEEAAELSRLRAQAYEAGRRRVQAGSVGSQSAYDGGTLSRRAKELKYRLADRANHALESIAMALDSESARQALRREGKRALEPQLRMFLPKQPATPGD